MSRPCRNWLLSARALVVDRRGAQRADQRRMLAARGAPQLEPGHPAEREQRLTDSAGSALHEHALASLHPRRARDTDGDYFPRLLRTRRERPRHRSTA